MDRYILASNSPRRRELLRLVISDYEVIPSEGEEIISSTKPDKVVEELSLQKAMDALVRLADGNRMVGIISHVSELRDRIDQQIIVRKDRTGGSSVELTT